MSFHLLVTPIAQKQIEDAWEYYLENVSEKISQLFKTDLEKAYNALSLNPFYQIRNKHYRALPLKKFPYLLFFEIDTEVKKVKILALFHTSKSPQKWP